MTIRKKSSSTPASPTAPTAPAVSPTSSAAAASVAHTPKPGQGVGGAVASSSELSAAFERARPAMVALPASELGRITANVPGAVATVLGAVHNVEAVRDDIARKLPEHDLGPINNLRGYAHALLFAHIMTLPSAEIETRLQALLAEAATRREHLLGVAEAFAPLGLVDGERVAAIRSGSGHVDTAQDLVALARLFHDHAAALEGKMPFTAADIDRANELGLELFDLLGRRKVGNDGAALSEYEEARLRAFRLMVQAYDSARAAVSYLRWREGDAEKLVPSIFGGRGRRRGASDPDEGEAPVEGEGVDSNATGTQ